MIHECNLRTMTHFFLIATGIGLAGCASTGQRNLSDAIVVTSSPSLAEGQTKLVLELRDARDEVPLNEVEAFLASDRAAGLSRANRSGLRERARVLHLTMPQARQELVDGLAMIRPDPGKALADGNCVVYLAGKTAVHVLFSCAEVDRLLAFKECADDLSTIRYSHPEFESAQLAALRDRAAESGLKVAGAATSKTELDRLKTEAATRVLEQRLRASGLPLPGGAPLLISGPLSPTRSPKLEEALKDPSVVERVLHDHDPDALRALVFLINRDVIELDYP